MYSTSDTIVAISTPPGRGAIGIVRLSGPEAHRIARELLARPNPLEPRHATFGVIHAAAIRDQVVTTLFPGPASYTGEDVVELSAHGSSVVLQGIVRAAMALGARLAAPGEFTLRAFLNGRMDLPQAESVADLIEAVTPLQARTAFDQLNGTLTSRIAAVDAALFDVVSKLEASVDFPDEGYHFIAPDDVATALDEVGSQLDGLIASGERGRVVREGVQVTLVGRPNAGKSSLFNALVGAHRAIVTAQPGTTRDLLTEVVDLNGLRATLVDTAGLREAEAEIEREGIERARGAARVSQLILVVCDGSVPWTASDDDIVSEVVENKTLIVSSKADMPAAWTRDGAVRVSAKTGDGLDRLIAAVHEAVGAGPEFDSPAVSNIRHLDLLRRARASVATAHASAVVGRLSEEFVLADLEAARRALEEVTGARSPDDVLVHVFERFCIGK